MTEGVTLRCKSALLQWAPWMLYKANYSKEQQHETNEQQTYKFYFSYPLIINRGKWTTLTSVLVPLLSQFTQEYTTE